jgi:hypothetical protein
MLQLELSSAVTGAVTADRPVIANALPHVPPRTASRVEKCATYEVTTFVAAPDLVDLEITPTIRKHQHAYMLSADRSFESQPRQPGPYGTQKEPAIAVSFWATVTAAAADETAWASLAACRL